jgi:uncharacterized protein
MMRLSQNIEIIDLGLFIIDRQILIFCDTQIGYEESLNKKGIFIPRFQFNDLVKRMEKIILKARPKKIIINGDIKHEFGEISKTEWRYTIKLIDLLSKYGDMILIKGNHDKILGPIADKKNIKILDYFVTEDIYLCHGHEIPTNLDFKKSKTIIIGHEHPAISFKEESRKEKYKCFLKGNYKDKTLIVQPSFNLITEGTDILSEKLLSPFLIQDLSNFEVFVVSDEILSFGKIKNLG